MLAICKQISLLIWPPHTSDYKSVLLLCALATFVDYIDDFSQYLSSSNEEVIHYTRNIPM